tara:strand:- start:499 stop:642 length:144 start_codon:yes stop_codon:yes gene_type:complete
MLVLDGTGSLEDNGRVVQKQKLAGNQENLHRLFGSPIPIATDRAWSN